MAEGRKRQSSENPGRDLAMPRNAEASDRGRTAEGNAHDAVNVNLKITKPCSDMRMRLYTSHLCRGIKTRMKSTQTLGMSVENQGNFPFAALLNEVNTTKKSYSRHSCIFSVFVKSLTPSRRAQRRRKLQESAAPPRVRLQPTLRGPGRGTGEPGPRGPRPPAPPLAGAAPGPTLIGGVAIPDLHRPGSDCRSGARMRRRQSAAAAAGMAAGRGGGGSGRADVL